MSIVRFMLDATVSNCKRHLSETSAIVDDLIEDEQTFDSVYRTLLQQQMGKKFSVGDTNVKLNPCLLKAKSLANSLQASTGTDAYSAYIWRTLFALLQVGGNDNASVIWEGATDTKHMLQATFQAPEHMSNIFDHLCGYHLILPDFDKSEHLYDSDQSELLCILADFYGDYLTYLTTLLQIPDCQRSGSVFRKQSSTAKPNAKKILNTLKELKEGSKLRTFAFVDAVKTASANRLRNEPAVDKMAIRPAGNQRPAAGSIMSERTITSRRTRANPRSMVNMVRRNLDFFGRSSALSEIARYLEPSRGGQAPTATELEVAEPNSCIVHGIGGVGKTHTTVEYAYRHQTQYEWVFWVRAESPAEILKSFSTIGIRTGVLTNDYAADPNMADRILEWFETTGQRWLLVFDNVELWDDIERYWPQSTLTSSSIIVTTQKPGEVLPWSTNTVQLLPFDTTDGSSLLLNRFNKEDTVVKDRELAMEITDIIGGLPLYLNQATGYIKIAQCTFAEYLSLLRDTSSIPQHPTTDRNLGYDKPWNAAFDIALRKLSDGAQQLLYILAFLNPESVPEGMVFANHTDKDLAFLRSDENKFFMVAQLRDSQLVKRDTINGDICLVTHRSVQRNILHKLSQSEMTTQRQKSFDMAVKMLRAVLPGGSALEQPLEDWATIEKYLPQMQSLEGAYTRAKSRIAGSLDLAEAFSRYGVDLFDRNLIRIGEQLLRTGLEILDTLPSQDQSKLFIRAKIQFTIGMYTDTLGISRRDEGLKSRHEVLELRTQAMKERATSEITVDEDIRLHNAVMDLSCSNQQFNRFDQVEKLSNRCFRQYKTWGLPDAYPYEYAKYYHSMSFVYVYRRQTNLAVRFAKRGADLMAQANPVSLLTTIYRFDWAITLFHNGDIEQALCELEGVLDVRIEKCGKSNPLTLQSYLVLGVINYLINRYSVAKDWIRKVLIHQQKADWPMENVARAKYYFNLILKATALEAQTLRQEDPLDISLSTTYSTSPNPKALEELSNHDKAEIFRNEAETVLDQLLPSGREELLEENINAKDADSILYDYMAPWGYRVVVKQVPDYEEALKLGH